MFIYTFCLYMGGVEGVKGHATYHKVITIIFFECQWKCIQKVNTDSSVVEMTRERTEGWSSVKNLTVSMERGLAPGLASYSTIICSRGEPTSESPESTPVINIE